MKKVVKASIIVLTSSLTVAGVGSSARASESISLTSQTNIESFQIAPLNYVLEGETQRFNDLPPKHWAYKVVNQAVRKSYVAGYPDGTFKPEKEVKRAEFIKMLVSGTNIKKGTGTAKWYTPFIEAAQQEEWIVNGDFKDNNVEKEMTRIEMAKIAVRAIGEAAKTDAEYMLVAAQKGIIHGLGKGELKPNDTTTRAQSVAVMERILTVRGGGKLEVDPLAIVAAQDWVGGRKDAWGNKIRTTNLPKNHADFVYILDYMPNAAYEMGHGPYTWDNNTKPVDLFAEKHLTEANLGQLKANVEEWFDLTLNLDYRTIDYKWADKMFNSQDLGQYTAEGKQNYINSRKAYVDWIKENKVVTKGKAIAEPSTIRLGKTAYIKVYYEYQVVSANKGAIVYTGKSANSIFYGYTDQHKPLYSKDYKMGQVIKVVSEMSVVANKSKGAGYWSSYRVNMPDLSANFVIVK